jgi:hypothetical protein
MCNPVCSGPPSSRHFPRRTNRCARSLFPPQTTRGVRLASPPVLPWENLGSCLGLCGVRSHLCHCPKCESAHHQYLSSAGVFCSHGASFSARKACLLRFSETTRRIHPRKAAVCSPQHIRVQKMLVNERAFCALLQLCAAPTPRSPSARAYRTSYIHKSRVRKSRLMIHVHASWQRHVTAFHVTSDRNSLKEVMPQQIDHLVYTLLLHIDKRILHRQSIIQLFN